MPIDWDNDDAERAEACDGARGVCVQPPEVCSECRWGELAAYVDDRIVRDIDRRRRASDMSSSALRGLLDAEVTDAE